MEKGDSKALREKRLELCMGHLTAKVPERVIKKKKKKDTVGSNMLVSTKMLEYQF